MIKFPSFSSFLFTSALQSKILITTDQESVQVNVEADGNDLLTVSLYTYNKRATLYDLRSVLDTFLEDNWLTTVEVTLTATAGDETATATFRAIYASIHLSVNAKTFLDSHFLNTLSAIQIPRSGYISLTFIPTTDGELTPYTDYVLQHADGTVEVIRFNRDTEKYYAGEYYDCTFSPSDDLLDITEEEGAKILSFTHHVGQRALTIYVTDDEPDITLQVLNEFLCPEFLYFHAVTKQVLSLERSTAQCLGTSTFYDDQSDLEFEVSTAMLSYEDAHHLSKILLSPSLQILEDSWQPILLTELTSELTDARNATNTIKFKYRYTTRRRPQPIPQSVDIFTGQYTPEYD